MSIYIAHRRRTHGSNGFAVNDDDDDDIDDCKLIFVGEITTQVESLVIGLGRKYFDSSLPNK